jgi:hypothetical protein
VDVYFLYPEGGRSSKPLESKLCGFANHTGVSIFSHGNFLRADFVVVCPSFDHSSSAVESSPELV